MKRNWKTTAAGIGALLSAVGDFLTAYYDGSDLTQPNYQAIVGLVIIGFGLIFAKDGDKT